MTASNSTWGRWAVAASAVLCAVALAGCTSGPGEPKGGPTPSAFTERESLPSCGEIVLGQGEDVSQEATDCMASAGAGGAELSLTRPTTEGDPFTEYYRVLPAGGWEVYTDMTQDSYGEGWWLNTCPDATALDDLGDCESVRL